MRRVRVVVVAAVASVGAFACSEVPDLHFDDPDATDGSTVVPDAGVDAATNDADVIDSAPSPCPGAAPEGGICCGSTSCINCSPSDCNDCDNAGCRNGRQCCRRNNNIQCRDPNNC